MFYQQMKTEYSKGIHTMLITKRSFLMIALLFLLCSGCAFPTSKNPLVNPSDAKAFPELHGVYRSEEKEDNTYHYAHIGPAGDQYPKGFLRIISVGQSSGLKSELKLKILVGFVEKIGKEYLLHFPIPENYSATDNKLEYAGQIWDASKVGSYLIIKLSLSPETLSMTLLDEEFIEEMIKTKKLAGLITPRKKEKQNGKYVTIPKSIIITAGIEELRQFFKQHLDGNLFQKEDFIKMKRLE
jgi:hypothetical protein